MTRCNICDEGVLSTQSSLMPIEYGGRQGTFAMRFKVCSYCGAETVDAEDSLLNRRSANRFKKSVANIPAGTRIRLLRRDLGLTQVEAGAIFGGGPVAFSKYESDDLIPDAAMSNLLRLAIFNPDIVKWLKDLRDGAVIFGTGQYSEPFSGIDCNDIDDALNELGGTEGQSLYTASGDFPSSDSNYGWVKSHEQQL